jgi:twitching motility protein PilT
MSSSAIINFQKYLQESMERKGSEIHFSVGQVPHFRIEGNLIPSHEGNIVSKQFVSDIFNRFADDNAKWRFEQDKEVAFAKTLENDTRFKFSAFYQKENISLSLRYIPAEPPKLESLGLPSQIKSLLSRSRGLIIISGPFDSGRTTTAAALIEHINQSAAKHIVTIEDPIEYVFTAKKSIVEQREIGRDALTYEQALKSVLKEDIDMVFVSEINRPEIITQALEVAEAGHLVVAISHAHSSVKVIEKLIESLPEGSQNKIRNGLADSLVAVIVQRLVPRVGQGRILVTELLSNTQSMHLLIREGRYTQIQSLVQTSREEGMITLDQALVQLLKAGKIDARTALKEAIDPENLEKRIKGS